MGKKDESRRMPHITLRGDDSTRIRGIGVPPDKPIDKPIEREDFINKLNKVIDKNTVKLESSEKTYFLIDLNLPYYNGEVQALLKRLKLDLKSVMGKFRILVSSEKKILLEYLEKNKLHKSTLKVIKDIRELESSKKIGASLRKLIREDIDNIKSFSVFIQLIDLNEEEKEKCLNSLKSVLFSEKSLRFYKASQTISCICSSSKINEVSEIPFVKMITESPQAQRIIDTEDGEIIVRKEEVGFTEYSDENITPICLLDTGVSKRLDPFVIAKDSMINSLDFEDNLDHGTSVASVAIFGEDLLDKKSILTPKTKLISFKIDDPEIPREEVNLEEAIKQAVKKYKSRTPIFNLSYNYEAIPNELRKEMANRIDKFLQKENVLLVNSAGNIPLDLAFHLKNRYPDYLSQHNVYCPAECRNIISVGSIANNSSQNSIVYSRHTRVGIPPDLQEEEVDKYEYIKPEIHTYGGDSFPDEIKRTNIIDKERGFPVIDNLGNMVVKIGTSFSAPLISLCLSRLYSNFGNKLVNSETYKSILINQCVRNDCNRMSTFCLLNSRLVGNCDDGIYLNFEGTSTPHEKSEEVRRSHVIKCKRIKFHVPEEAESIDAVISHSNNYENQLINKMNTKVILKLIKPSGTACQKEYGNIGRPSAITFSHYKFRRDYAGEWEAELHIETSGIPKEIFEAIKVRYGVSLKINIKEKHLADIKDIYDEVYEKSKSVLKEKQGVGLEESSRMPQLTHNSERVMNPPAV